MDKKPHDPFASIQRMLAQKAAMPETTPEEVWAKYVGRDNWFGPLPHVGGGNDALYTAFAALKAAGKIEEGHPDGSSLPWYRLKTEGAQ